MQIVQLRTENGKLARSNQQKAEVYANHYEIIFQNFGESLDEQTTKNLMHESKETLQHTCLK